jgi:anti-sigma factor RsiW
VGSSLSCPDSEVVDLILDGEASPEQQKHLEQCEECRGRHDFYSRFRQTIRTSCSQETTPELVQARLLKALGAEVQSPKPAKRPVWGLGAVAAASAALFSFVALRPANDKATPLALSLSQDHSRCESAPASQRPPQSPAQMAQIAYGAPMPEMAEVQQLRPYDVRLCPVLHGERVIHVLYRDQRDRVVSLYTMPTSRVQMELPGVEGKPLYYNTEDARVASWQHKGWIFSLVSRLPQAELATMADTCCYDCTPSSPNTMPGNMPMVVPAQGGSGLAVPADMRN